MIKKCSKCGHDFPATNEYFYGRADSKDGLRSDCRKCTNTRTGQYARSNPDKIRSQHRRSYVVNMYGITQGQYDEMLQKQGGVCAICGKPESRTDPRSGVVMCLSVDHDHSTGMVRGLLCNSCNHAVGVVESMGVAVGKYLNDNGNPG